MNDSSYVKRWRHNCKKRIIESMGGKCGICGYNKCQAALALHHIDPEHKKFSLGKIMAQPAAWEKIIEELRKCTLLCHNCHSEVHNDVTLLPTDAPRFNEKFADYKNLTDNCPVCGKQKSIGRKTCSKSCGATLSWSVDWNNINLDNISSGSETITEVANKNNITFNAVYKRIKRDDIKYTNKSIKKDVNKCEACAKELYKSTTSGLCGNCYKKTPKFSKRKTIRPTKEILEQEIKEMSWTDLGKKYNVSDNAVKKWARSYNIPFTTKKYNTTTIPNHISLNGQNSSV